MKLNQCDRCGSFFSDDALVCPKCAQKDKSEISKLTVFLKENNNDISVKELANTTGISFKNINRFLKNDEVSTSFENLGLTINNEDKFYF